jgi:ribosomal protein S18 acetylase RimI-like enzyme
MIPIRKLNGGDWEILREIRIKALTDAPLAFNMSLEEASSKDDSYWKAKVLEWDWFVAVDAGKPVGTVSVEYASLEKEKHTVDLRSLYVVPEHRTRGIGRMLMDAALADIMQRSEIVRIGLWVMESQKEAIALYESLGFEREGLRKKDQLVDGVFYAAVAMVKFLR